MAPIALITGASAGIGLELAKLFAADGYGLMLVATREERLKALAAELGSKYSVPTYVFPADLSDKNSPERIFQFAKDNQITIDVVVNNAGFGAQGEFAKLDMQRQLDMVQVNIAALVHLSRLFLPGMLERKTGGILNVASTAAFVAGPLMAVYYASKAFVLSFSEAIANEVAGTGVHVSCLCPGATYTEFQDRAGMEKSKLFTGPMVMDAATVARMGYDGFKSNKPVVVCGIANQLAVAATRFVPRQVAASLARSFQKPN